jgi:hypothetical protein
LRAVLEPNGRTENTGLNANGLLLGASKFLRNSARAALLLPLALQACSSMAQPKEDEPATGPDPGINRAIAEELQSTFKDYASYDAFEISAFRWVHSLQGWNWLTCVHFQDDKGRARVYALFIRGKKVINSRYAVEADGCGTQAYAPFSLMGRRKLLEPLY